jgi:nitrogen-specific signal transduction histidine kinase/CheY-like chemotaxis protein
LTINTDITEKKKLEAQFLRAQRLESIGTLASGIAHDLNNILSPISMGVQILRSEMQDERSQGLLDIMQANASRGAEMIKHVLSFAKGISGQRVILQPKHLIHEILQIAAETFPKSIRIERKLADDLWMIRGDATQLHQVLLNLCVNARDAMPQGGTLRIAAENQPLDTLYAQMLKGATAGNFVVITIADTGLGIAPEIIDRIFDPFFTTKEPGQGTGLGLATVQGIVANHGGFINVESKPGIGTKFSIYLPSNEVASLQKTVESEPEMPLGEGELILVVDDEAAVREMTSAALEAFGYRALTADGGTTALSVYVSHMNEVSAVIINLMMPVMDGIAAIHALRTLNPDIRIIASSGLVDPVITDKLSMLQVDDLLEKPYNASILLNTIAKALRKHSPSTTNA